MFLTFFITVCLLWILIVSKRQLVVTCMCHKICKCVLLAYNLVSAYILYYNPVNIVCLHLPVSSHALVIDTIYHRNSHSLSVYLYIFGCTLCYAVTLLDPKCTAKNNGARFQHTWQQIHQLMLIDDTTQICMRSMLRNTTFMYADYLYDSLYY